ncbi:MAG: phosphoesterase [Deltaproteobacteria bacterium]|jgi:nanoRNase/pAp phosphatase (c-di-AMP/oligoRNAs hydrolase)|nr:phosphoesterase [Deltaproteobacteria bacterium]MBT4087798.1 phosphoesterase [Deltaproteobacteria bacterium]MBT4265891.1 phosphoesterase [Deltaproteobacteria bacterium]MBT4643687.1 phosphoesterase [Deltaproteobacteria bacterium]MBT6503276.1 phosphoesterase [Deltaproteobacteria bacterium]
MASIINQKLDGFYQQFLGEHHVVILINADPDAIGSAMAVKRLLWRKAASITIAHVNTIKRQDNLAMIRRLNIRLVPFSKIEIASFDRIVMVDSQPVHHELFTSIHPHVIIDHHPQSDIEATYMDIRPNYGATASILTEYLKAAKIKPSTKLATALYYGIKTDTSNFERQTIIEDVRAFQYLFKQANVQLAKKIDQSEMRPRYLKHFKNAIENKRFKKGWMFSHLGKVGSPDVCVMVADFFMRVDDVNWTVVSGIHGNKFIVIFRSDGLRRNAGKIACDSLGQFGSAGGHRNMARAEISLSDLKDQVNPENEKKVLNWIISRISQRRGGR